MVSSWLLINPDSSSVFKGTSLAAQNSRNDIPLGLLCVGGELLCRGHQLQILDLNCFNDKNYSVLIDRLKLKPEFIGIHALISNYKEIRTVLDIINIVTPRSKVIIGGPHAAFMTDVGNVEVYIGEYEKYHNLDDISFPAYSLIDKPSDYSMSRLLCRKNPVAFLEFSRGCYGKCTFCDNSVFGRKMRFKSPDRVLGEILYVLSLGFNEIQIVDAMFTADIDWVKEICERIIRSGKKFIWYPRSGVRVDKADLETYKLMKRAGCYRLPFGCESGSQRILDSIEKEITLDEIAYAVDCAKKAKLEAECFFIMGLPGETEEDLQATIDFAKKLKPDYLKPPQFACPLPGTELFEKMKPQLKTLDFSNYHYFSNYRNIYDHDTLSWDVLESYRKKFISEIINRPDRLFKAGVKAAINGKWKVIARNLFI